MIIIRTPFENMLPFAGSSGNDHDELMDDRDADMDPDADAEDEENDENDADDISEHSQGYLDAQDTSFIII